MQKFVVRILFIVGFICCTSMSTTHAEQYLYTKLSENSWRIPRARTLYKEAGKYLWIGTHKGVYRFNGYDFKHYTESKTVSTIHGIATNHISMDSQGNLWVLTDKGIGRYNRNGDCFEWASQQRNTKGPFFMSCQLNDKILFAGQGKILSYGYDNKKFTLFKDLTQEYGVRNIRYMYAPNNKSIVLDYGNKIIKLDTGGNKIAEFCCPSFISCMYVDNQQRIWTGCYDKSLSCYDTEGRILTKLTASNSHLSNEVILSMEQEDSLLWIGTDGGGINILNTLTNDIQTLRHIQGEVHSFPDNSINCLYKDLQNTIWAGSVRHGIIAIRKSAINSYAEVHENCQGGLSNPTILSFYQEPGSECVWIGTDGEGINKLNLNTRTFTHFPSTKGTKIVSIAKYDDKTLLLSLYTKGLFFFNTQTGNLRPLNINKKELELKMIVGKTDINLYNHPTHHILALTDKVFKYNEQTRMTEEVPFQTKAGFQIILPIGEYKEELFLYNEAAIYKLNQNATLIEIVYKMPDEQEIVSSAIDQEGNIWLATNRGIAYYSIEKGNIVSIENNLLCKISTIVADTKGRIWMGEEDKVYVYTASTKNLAIFGKSDGIIPNKYIEKSHFITQQGDIMLGGTKGLTVIDRDFTLEANERPNVMITGIKIDDKEYNEYDVQALSVVEIPSESKTVEIRVTSAEEDILRPKIYRYELRGENEQVIESNSPILRLQSFHAGKSVVYVSCSIRSGEWTTPTQVATLFFMPPWYQTNWFYVVCMCVLIIVSTSILLIIIRRKENKLKLAFKEKEKKIYEEKVKFLININHELRTPLTLISGPLQRMLQKAPTSSSSMESLKKIYRQAERMKKLLNMILDLRKMEVGESTMNIQSVAVNEWISEVVADFSFDDDTANSQISLSLDEKVGTVYLDKERCEIILTNLLVNAIKHCTEQDRILVKTEISSDQMLQISVIDEGEGLKNVNIDKLFNRFYQGSDETNGSGIGLSYAKMLVDLHKGTIGAFNNQTKGATFYVKIPQNLSVGSHSCEPKQYLNDLFNSDSYIGNSTPICQTEVLDTTNKTILIIDDNVEFTTFLKEYFMTRFSKVFLAHDGKKALDIIQKESIDIVVSDVMMPKMNGFELCQRIKANMKCSHVPVILLTAVNEEHSRKLGYKMGADAYISKPFETETLYELIKGQLNIREKIKHKYMQFSVLPEPQKDTFSQVDENFLIHLNKIIVDNISDTALDIPFVCQEIGMSRASLYNKLKALTDMSCNEYINKIRMERAIILIKSTNKSFIEIADETGYANSRYFSTSFKQNTGMTPTQYRKEYGLGTAKIKK